MVIDIFKSSRELRNIPCFCRYRSIVLAVYLYSLMIYIKENIVSIKIRTVKQHITSLGAFVKNKVLNFIIHTEHF